MNPNLNKPLFSIVVLIYHRTQDLVDMAMDCVASVKNSSMDYELIIVDNCSTVRSDYWEKNADTYIRFNQNMGISHGWNQGIKAARGKYIAIINDDIKVHSGWLGAMKEGMDQPNAGMCNPHVEHLPAGMGIVENYKWPSGSCFMLTQDVVSKVGYFDEDTFFPAQFEDTDYWTRLYKAGLKIYTNYHLTVQHLEGQTDNAPDISSHFEENKKRFIEKHQFDPLPIFYGEGIMPRL